MILDISIKRKETMEFALMGGLFCLFVMYMAYLGKEKETERILAVADSREAILLRTLEVAIDAIDEVDEERETPESKKKSE